MNVKLASFADVKAEQVKFWVTLTNPCLTTTLSLPTTLAPVTITSTSGVSVTQNFAPATDSAATSALNLTLCGSRIYSIVEA